MKTKLRGEFERCLVLSFFEHRRKEYRLLCIEAQNWQADASQLLKQTQAITTLREGVYQSLLKEALIN